MTIERGVHRNGDVFTRAVLTHAVIKATGATQEQADAHLVRVLSELSDEADAAIQKLNESESQ